MSKEALLSSWSSRSIGPCNSVTAKWGSPFLRAARNFAVFSTLAMGRLEEVLIICRDGGWEAAGKRRGSGPWHVRSMEGLDR
jgi:hypothetical protein